MADLSRAQNAVCGLRMWRANANKKARDKALNQKHKIINLKSK